MANRCPKYLCATTSMEGLVQQIAVSYLRHGYWWYVTGMIPERKDLQQVDENILTKYDVRKDWRFIAERKSRGVANLQYIRNGRFFVILATKGHHEFKQREAKRLRDVRTCPILIPLRVDCERLRGRHFGERRATPCEGYALSYRRGGYKRKSRIQKEDYRLAINEWNRQTSNGVNLPKPPRGEPDPKWHSRVEIERGSYLRFSRVGVTSEILQVNNVSTTLAGCR